jgi:2-keto-4-pentenoate hydratase/2-oxohepta-3-ene-1,7-dioic acid hydratase in catechol pathway
MRLTTFKRHDRADLCLGALVGELDWILDLGASLDEAVDEARLLSWLDLDGELWPKALLAWRAVTYGAEPMETLAERGLAVRRSEARILAPVPRPGKLLCIGLNYRDHAKEGGVAAPASPILFSKFSTAIVGPGDPVLIPRGSQKVDYEAELAVVVGRRVRRATSKRALDAVLGYTCINDISARDFQFGDGQWQRGKSCDTFAPMGPCVVTSDEITDPQGLPIRLRLNGQVMQESNTREMIFGVAQLITFISETITLEPGDVIATGTPSGVGFARKPPVFLKAGDALEVSIDGIGSLANPVVGEP